MKYISLRWLSTLNCSLGVCLTFATLTAHAQNITEQQLGVILPDSQAIQGFGSIIPRGEFAPPGTWQPHDNQWIEAPVAITPARDGLWLNQSADQLSPFWRPIAIPNGKYSLIDRCLWSTNGLYSLEMRVELCDSATTASAELTEIRQQSQIALMPGTFHSSFPLGDESWFYPDTEEHVLRGRCGRLLFTVVGEPSWAAKKSGVDTDFPDTAVEAVAYQILLQASQQASLTGVPAQNAHLAVNGHALPKNALKLAGRVYVPVQEFAKAMGMTSQWNSKTGALTLSGPNRKTVTLTAGSAQASVGGVKAAALTVPVLKSSGQPVMTLGDLLRLTGGRVTSQTGNTVQVKG